jgi:hypothetical protein
MLIGLLFTLAITAQHSLGSDNRPTFDHNHTLWNRVLHSIVTPDGSRSHVNYAQLKINKKDLDTYLVAIENVTLSEFSTFSEKEKLAYLINAYNALTVQLIVDHYPVKSIKDIGGFLSSPWKLRFFDLFGQKHHLDDIEHEMIRKNFLEPRIHFALVCASTGCPGLRNEAYIAPKLEEQLENNATLFLEDPSRNRFDHETKTLYLSSIFQWYGSDFEKIFGSLKAYLAPRLTKNPADQADLLSPQTKTSYLEYDWTLNE